MHDDPTTAAHAPAASTPPPPPLGVARLAELDLVPVPGEHATAAGATAGATELVDPPHPAPLDRVAGGLPRPPRRPTAPRPDRDADDGSLVTEYGLLAVLGATAVSLVLKFLAGGALFELFGSILGKVQALVGM